MELVRRRMPSRGRVGVVRTAVAGRPWIASFVGGWLGLLFLLASVVVERTTASTPTFGDWVSLTKHYHHHSQRHSHSQQQQQPPSRFWNRRSSPPIANARRRSLPPPTVWLGRPRGPSRSDGSSQTPSHEDNQRWLLRVPDRASPNSNNNNNNASPSSPRRCFLVFPCRLPRIQDFVSSSSNAAAISIPEPATPIQRLQQQQQQQRWRGGGRTAAAAASTATLVPTAVAAAASRPLVFWENMICGAISRSMAQTIMHPANTMKTILQNSRRLRTSATTGTGATAVPTIATLLLPKNFHRLTMGAGANFIMSIPHGAVNFAVLELVRQQASKLVQASPWLAANEDRFAFGLDFLSSSISTLACSVVSTPQMMIVDNIMAGNYPNMVQAATGLAKSKGILGGFYSGWGPGLAGKIPSYGLTWTFFQQLKQARTRWTSGQRPATDLENSVMGCLASAATVCLMIPMDTIKTRLVAQAGRAASPDSIPYKGIVDCAVRVFREEGMSTFYRGLPPRLVSVVPMIGIQFGVYEFMKRVMLQRRVVVAAEAAADAKKNRLAIPPPSINKSPMMLEENTLPVETMILDKDETVRKQPSALLNNPVLGKNVSPVADHRRRVALRVATSLRM